MATQALAQTPSSQTNSYKESKPEETVFYSRWLYGNHTARTVAYMRNSELYKNAYDPEGNVLSEWGRLAYGLALSTAALFAMLCDFLRNCLAVGTLYYAFKRVWEYMNSEGPFALPPPQPLSPTPSPSTPIRVQHAQSAQAAPALAISRIQYSDEERRNVQKLIMNMADNNWIWLAAHVVEMYSLGAILDPLHPFAFIAILHDDPECRRRLGPLSQESLKWNQIIQGITKTAIREMGNGNLLPQIPQLSQTLGIDESTLKSYFEGSIRIRELVQDTLLRSV